MLSTWPRPLEGRTMSTTSTMTPDAIAELRLQLHDFMLGFARVDAAGMGRLVRPDWALAARIELLRRHPLVAALGDELLSAISARTIDPNLEARYLQCRLRESEEEAAADASRDSARFAPPAPHVADLPPTVLDMMHATIALIGRDRLGFTTLETRHSDSLDFRDCSVGGVRDALIEAYEEGWHAAA
jgi:hypothetical protein